MKQYNEILSACKNILKTEKIAENARNYLNNRASKEMQNKFEFGYFPQDSDLSYLTSILDNPSALEDSGLVYRKYEANGIKKTSAFNLHNIIFPTRDRTGNIVSLVGRTELDDENIDKYKYSFGTSKSLNVFGIDKAYKEIVDKNCVICVEGQFDCISCHSIGLENTVALGGANMSVFQFFVINSYTNNIILLFDNDQAGKEGKRKIKEKYGDYANIKSIYLDFNYKDIDSYIRAENPINFKHFLNKVINEQQT